MYNIYMILIWLTISISTDSLSNDSQVTNGEKIVQKKLQPRPPNLGKNLKAKTMKYLFPKKNTSLRTPEVTKKMK